MTISRTRDCSPSSTTICMFKIVCVTNRLLCKGDFLKQIEKTVAASPDALILREKDLSHEEYLEYATWVAKICDNGGVELILHSDTRAAELLGRAVQMPIPVLRKTAFSGRMGASCHSLEDALEAQKRGCSYITAGHIFNTGCKNEPGRGLDFLKEIVSGVHLPVYAIGGINKDNISGVMDCGASGVCIMSSAMRLDVGCVIADLKNSIENYKKEQII